ncbi:acyl-CoA N-acyltransferase [Syncephalis fuscata]|nr:acyl-CoA N-acyltransferase [Syncephalis fuscata]
MSLQSEFHLTTDTATAADVSRRPDRLALVDLTINNVGQLRCLNRVLFPIQYPDSFYEAAPDNDWYKLGFFNDVCVAAVCCRKEPHPTKPKMHRVYLMTLGVLAPYRRLGMGAKMLEYALEQCQQDSSVSEIYLHVQEGNDDALNFYKKRQFTITESVTGYYTQIQPDTAYILTKSFE